MIPVKYICYSVCDSMLSCKALYAFDMENSVTLFASSHMKGV